MRWCAGCRHFGARRSRTSTRRCCTRSRSSTRRTTLWRIRAGRLSRGFSRRSPPSGWATSTTATTSRRTPSSRRRSSRTPSRSPSRGRGSSPRRPSRRSSPSRPTAATRKTSIRLSRCRSRPTRSPTRRPSTRTSRPTLMASHTCRGKGRSPTVSTARQPRWRMRASTARRKTSIEAAACVVVGCTGGSAHVAWCARAVRPPTRVGGSSKPPA
mmetsp:Transcript_50114/g.138860  ORF Transcript_50114/g.138860 Transcript_50114/m.138860 type:complete len:213 (+) Transcript_50114:651-1289(+)